MKNKTEIKSLQEVSEMAQESLNPDLYEKFCTIHDEIIKRRGMPNKPILFWVCKYCGENETPKCHKCIREDGEIVSDELIAGPTR